MKIEFGTLYISTYLRHAQLLRLTLMYGSWCYQYTMHRAAILVTNDTRDFISSKKASIRHSPDTKASGQRLADGGLYGLSDKFRCLADLLSCILWHCHSPTGAAALHDARLVA